MRKGKLSLEIQKRIINALEKMKASGIKTFSVGKIKEIYQKTYNKKISYLTTIRHLNALARIGKLKKIEVASVHGETSVYQFL
ncbi:MAG: hypothetical protein NZ889_00705 [Candidatus Pacearchaeota archaeon]|nr:hypothetical protein [Candidatus Pacearchaeota archaeon]